MQGCDHRVHSSKRELLLHTVLRKELREKEPTLASYGHAGDCEEQQELLAIPRAHHCCTGTPVVALNKKSAFQLKCVESLGHRKQSVCGVGVYGVCVWSGCV